MELGQFVLPNLDRLSQAPECEIYQSWPQGPGEEHNLLEPEKCRCIPYADLFLDDDGMIGMMIVQHKWVQ